MSDDIEPAISGPAPVDSDVSETPRELPPVVLRPLEPLNASAQQEAINPVTEAVGAVLPVATPIETTCASEPVLLVPARPGPGFLAAIAAIIALFVLQIPFGFVLAIGALVLHTTPDSRALIAFQSVVTLLVTIGLARVAVGANWRQKLAIRPPCATHLLLVSLLVIPLAVVDSEISRVLSKQ